MKRLELFGLFLVLLLAASCAGPVSVEFEPVEPIDGDHGSEQVQEIDPELPPVPDGDPYEQPEQYEQYEPESAEPEWSDWVDPICEHEVCACDAANPCPPDYGCSPAGVCRKPECINSTSCLNASWYCNGNGFCEQYRCLENADCHAGMQCEAGVCEIRDCEECWEIVVINEGSGVIAEGATRQLTATARDKRGIIYSYVTFTWQSDSPDVVSVDSNGLIHGGAKAGTAKITAKAGSIVSAPVTYTNFPGVQGGTRVVVYDSTENALLPGVTVYLLPDGASPDADSSYQHLTDSQGSASFPGLNCASKGCTLHVLDPAYGFVSVFTLRQNAILIPLTKNVNNTVTDGVKGHLNTDAIPAARRGDVQMGLTMFNLPSNPLDWGRGPLFGDPINTHVRIGSIETDTLFPSGFEAYLNGIEPIKDGYYATGPKGPATLFAFGGYAVLGDLIDQISGSIGETIDYPAILGVLLPLFNDFYHGVQTGFTLTERPKMPDSRDQNNNDIRNELVPDLSQFATNDLKVTQRQTYDVSVRYPNNLPRFAGGKCTDMAVTVIGAMQRSVGFVPLGIQVDLDKKSKNDMGNCKLGASDDGRGSGQYAPQHSGLLGNNYTAVSYGFMLDELFDNNSDTAYFDYTAAITKSERAFDNDLNPIVVPAFLGLFQSPTAMVTSSHLSFKLPPINDATLYRAQWLSLSSDASSTRSWDIYWPAGSAMPDFDLPNGVENRAAVAIKGSRIQALRLDDTTNYEQTFGFGKNQLLLMPDHLKTYSTHYFIR